MIPLAPIPAIIPAYRAPEMLARCVEHLAAQSHPVSACIVDNSRENRLYTRAINIGLRENLGTASPYFLLLNQDMLLAPTAVAEMVGLMEARERIGIVMPLHLDPDAPEHVTCGGTERAFPLGQHYSGPLHAFSIDRELPWANGAALLLRKSMVQDIGLLDECMRFLCSDVDYSFTARARGWQVWLSVQARGYHKPNASMVSSATALELVKCDDVLAFADKWLTGGLYRRLAVEGPALTPASVEESLRELRQLRSSIADEIARGARNSSP
ncbi:MAG: glycosyltransferase family 2 protein [Proteobacteria bacterium]|nr:glycosyltransferase family 2 protein [Pseudomonadota bacterium]